MIGHAVYRIYDDGDRLLYVGCSTDPTGRVQRHVNIFHSATQASWDMAGLIAYWTTEWFPSKEGGFQAEREIIAAEAPLFNRSHNAGRHIDRETYFEKYGKGATVEESEAMTRPRPTGMPPQRARANEIEASA